MSLFYFFKQCWESMHRAHGWGMYSTTEPHFRSSTHHFNFLGHSQLCSGSILLAWAQGSLLEGLGDHLGCRIWCHSSSVYGKWLFSYIIDWGWNSFKKYSKGEVGDMTSRTRVCMQSPNIWPLIASYAPQASLVVAKREKKLCSEHFTPRTLRMFYNWEIRGTWVGNHAQNVGRAALVWPLCGSASITFLSLDRGGKERRDRFQGWVSAASLTTFTAGLSVSGSLWAS